MMARFFFDVADGKGFVRDDVGLEMQGDDLVRTEAIDALADVAREELPDGDEAVYAVEVRDVSGRVVFKATLNFKAEWC
jgi:hypothetical protein